MVLMPVIGVVVMMTAMVKNALDFRSHPKQLRKSALPQTACFCVDDLHTLCSLRNGALERLVYPFGVLHSHL